MTLFQQYCNPSGNELILEIGCGDGEFTRRLIDLDATIIASDLTFSLLKRAQEKNTFKKVNNIIFMMDDAEFLSFDDNSLDYVNGISILHHLDYKNALKETYRVLKKGADFFLRT